MNRSRIASRRFDFAHHTLSNAAPVIAVVMRLSNWWELQPMNNSSLSASFGICLSLALLVLTGCNGEGTTPAEVSDSAESIREPTQLVREAVLDLKIGICSTESDDQLAVLNRYLPNRTNLVSLVGENQADLLWPHFERFAAEIAKNLLFSSLSKGNLITAKYRMSQ